MDSIEPTTTHSWILILRVGKTHIHVIKIYQPLSTHSVNSFAPHTLNFDYIFIVLLLPATWLCGPQLGPNHCPDQRPASSASISHSSPATRSLISSHTQFTSRLLQLQCALPHMYTSAFPMASKSCNLSIKQYHDYNYRVLHIYSFYIPQTKGNACACFLSHAVINSSIYLNYNFPNCQKTIKPKWQYKLRDKRFFLLRSATSFRPSFTFLLSVFPLFPLLSHGPLKLSAPTSDGQLIVLTTTSRHIQSYSPLFIMN